MAEEIDLRLKIAKVIGGITDHVIKLDKKIEINERKRSDTYDGGYVQNLKDFKACCERYREALLEADKNINKRGDAPEIDALKNRIAYGINIIYTNTSEEGNVIDFLKRESSEIEKINAEIAENFAKTLEGRFDSTYAKAFEIYGEMSFNRAFDNDEVKNRLYKEMTLMEKDRGAFLGNPNFCENFISRVESDIEIAHNILNNYNEQKPLRDKLSEVLVELTDCINDIEAKRNDIVFSSSVEGDHLKKDLEKLKVCETAKSWIRLDDGELSKHKSQIDTIVDDAKKKLKLTKFDLKEYEYKYKEILKRIDEQKSALVDSGSNTQKHIPISSTPPKDLRQRYDSKDKTYKCSFKDFISRIAKNPFKACMNLPQKQPKNQS